MTIRYCQPTVLLLVAMVLPAMSVATEAGDDALPVASLSVLLDYADDHSPMLVGLAAETAAANARIDSAGALDDPMLRIEPEGIFDHGLQLSPSRVGRTRYELMQPLPWSGKRALRREVATAEAARSVAEFRSARSRLHREVRIAFADWREAVSKQHLLDEVEAILVDAETVARSRYAAGLVPQSDVLRAQLELTVIAKQRLELAGHRDAASARLNGLIGRRSQADLTPPPDDVLDPLPHLAAAIARLQQSAPEIEAAEALERAAASRSALTVRERWPDLRVGVMAMQRGSAIDEWGLMLELNLPLSLTRRRAQEAETAAMSDAAFALREAAVIRTLAAARATHAEASSALAQRQLIVGTMEVQAQLTLQAALSAYGAGDGPFLGVIDAALRVWQARVAAIDAAASYRRSLAAFLDYLGET